MNVYLKMNVITFKVQGNNFIRRMIRYVVLYRTVRTVPYDMVAAILYVAKYDRYDIIVHTLRSYKHMYDTHRTVRMYQYDIIRISISSVSVLSYHIL